MDELIVERVQPVLDGAFHIAVNFVDNGPACTQAGFIDFRDFVEGRPLALRQVAEEGKYDSVTFLGGVCIDACPHRRLAFIL